MNSDTEDYLGDLIKAKIGDQPYATYYVTGEGRIYDSGDEEMSGYVVTAKGQHYFFWTDWHPTKKVVYLETWEKTAPGLEEWQKDPEFLEALAKVGIAA